MQKLPAGRMYPAENKRNVWFAEVENRAAFDDLESPEFWSHVAAKLRTRDLIEVWTRDNSAVATCRVAHQERHGLAAIARVKMVLIEELSAPKPIAAPADEDPEYKIDWTEKTQFRVIQKSTRKPLKEGMGTRAEAELYVEQLKVKLGAPAKAA